MLSAPAGSNVSPGFVHHARTASPQFVDLFFPGPVITTPPSSTSPPRTCSPLHTVVYISTPLTTPVATPTPTAAAIMFERFDSTNMSHTVAGYASLLSGPLTYALTPSSARATGLQHTRPSPQPLILPTVQSRMMQAPPAAARRQQLHPEQFVGEHVEDDEDNEDESDEEGAVPMHLRNPLDAPRPPPGALHPSLGSANHVTGACKRCCFFPRGRCANGFTCEFCHYEHDKRKRKTKKKASKCGAILLGNETAAGGRAVGKISLASTMTYKPDLRAAQPFTGYTSSAAHDEKRIVGLVQPHVDSCTVTATCVNSPMVVPQSFVTYYQPAGCSYASVPQMFVQGYGTQLGQQFILYDPSQQQHVQMMSTAVPNMQGFMQSSAQSTMQMFMPPSMAQAGPVFATSALQASRMQEGFNRLPPPPMQSPKFRPAYGAMIELAYAQETPPVRSPDYP